MESSRTPIHNLTLADLRAVLEGWGERAYHAGQIFRWLYQRKATSFQQMTDLGKDLRGRLENGFSLDLPDKVEVARGADAEKWLLRLSDGLSVECVRIPSKKGDTACLSTQAGCRLACVFCASGTVRPVRNLQPGEMVGQLLHLLAGGAEVRSIVFMGMGEPFHNYENLMRAIEILQCPEGLKIDLPFRGRRNPGEPGDQSERPK
jgi:23S rRNA (adenine2503-C2)-methyltransferase